VPREGIKELLNEAGKRFAAETNLIQLESGRVIFVGDTHGGFEATEKIIRKHLKPGNKLVFLGTMLIVAQLPWRTLTSCFSKKLSIPIVFSSSWEIMKAMP